MLLSPYTILRCVLIRLHVMGYVLDMDTLDSVDRTVVAHLRAASTGALSSISRQKSSLKSSVLASVSLVTERSDRTADTAHRCSTSLPNMDTDRVPPGFTGTNESMIW